MRRGLQLIVMPLGLHFYFLFLFFKHALDYYIHFYDFLQSDQLPI